ncbi:transporter substrate-binding domain-containing protein [Alkalihalobacillus sp. 1P02AB]|uniref:transporter substrate-binding domain-containing protein n=1 Tax=Alkalihalobacillus sp. 1P02AB TaxID=3132260 RepID=UPI0039A4A3B7
MKKILSLLLMVMLMLTIAACGTTDDSAEENETAGDQPEETGTNEEDTSWADIEEAGKIIVGTSGTYSPVTYYNEDNELTGFDVELVREMANYLDVEVEFSTMDFDGILPALRNGQINFATNDFSITEERLETFDFTVPYKYSYGSIIVRAEDVDNFETANDLEGVDVALGSLTSNYARFAEHIGANGTAYDGGVEAILRDLISGNTDAYLNDRLVIARTIEEFGDDRLAVAPQVKYHETSSAMPVLKGNEALAERLSEAIEALIEDGTVARLSEEFLGEDASQPVDSSEVVDFDF